MLTALSWTDGDYTVATAVSNVELSQPFKRDKGMYLLSQKFWQFLANFVPLALNTPYPSVPYTSYVLVSESQLRDLGGGIVEWERTYAQVPASRDDWTTIGYQFIGYFGTQGNFIATPGTIIGRPRQTVTVPCRVQNDYYLVGTGGTFTTPDLIPNILEQKYYWPQGTLSAGVFIPIYPPIGSLDDIMHGLATDDIWNKEDFGALNPTVPSRTEYEALITAGTEIVAESSKITSWQGNIFQRQTSYIKAR